MPKISALPPAGTLADDDETPFNDDSVTTTKKFTLAGLLTWLQSKTSWIATAMITNGQVTPDKLDLDPAEATVATSQTRTATSYGDLATVGPAVTVTVGANGIVLLHLQAVTNNSANTGFMGFVASGANTIAAADTKTIRNTATVDVSAAKLFILTGLTPGVTTFTAKYKVSGGTGTWYDRFIAAIPL
jgi:hypothetical protein